MATSFADQILKEVDTRFDGHIDKIYKKVDSISDEVKELSKDFDEKYKDVAALEVKIVSVEKSVEKSEKNFEIRFGEQKENINKNVNYLMIVLAGLALLVAYGTFFQGRSIDPLNAHAGVYEGSLDKNVDTLAEKVSAAVVIELAKSSGEESDSEIEGGNEQLVQIREEIEEISVEIQRNLKILKEAGF